MLDLQSIEKVCDNVAGLKIIQVTAIDNIGEDLNPVQSGEVYTIIYRMDSARYTESYQLGSGGEYYRKEIQAFIPKRRASVEHMVRKLINRKVAVLAQDFNNEVYDIINAKFSHSFSTGLKPGDNNGYNISFKGVDLKRNYYRIDGLQLPTGNEGTTGGSDPGSGSVPSGDPGDPSSADCCVLVQPVQLTYIPGHSGNANNRNEMVISSDGTRWFIDKDGRGLDLSSGGNQLEIITGTGISFTPTFDISMYSAANLIIQRDGVTLNDTNPPTDPTHYYKNGGNIDLPPAWPLQAGETLRIHKI